MKIKAIYKSPNIHKFFKAGKSYFLDFQVCAKSFGSIKDVINIAEVKDYDQISETKYNSLKEFLKHWTII